MLSKEEMQEVILQNWSHYKIQNISKEREYVMKNSSRLQSLMKKLYFLQKHRAR